MSKLQSLSVGELLALGALRKRCSATLVCLPHGCPLPCDICQLEKTKAVLCTACGHEFSQGIAEIKNRACASEAEFVRTGRIAFEAEAKERAEDLKKPKVEKNEKEKKQKSQKQEKSTENYDEEKETEKKEPGYKIFVLVFYVYFFGGWYTLVHRDQEVNIWIFIGIVSFLCLLAFGAIGAYNPKKTPRFIGALFINFFVPTHFAYWICQKFASDSWLITKILFSFFYGMLALLGVASLEKKDPKTRKEYIIGLLLAFWIFIYYL